MEQLQGAESQNKMFIFRGQRTREKPRSPAPQALFIFWTHCVTFSLITAVVRHHKWISGEHVLGVREGQDFNLWKSEQNQSNLYAEDQYSLRGREKNNRMQEMNKEKQAWADMFVSRKWSCGKYVWKWNPVKEFKQKLILMLFSWKDKGVVGFF